jgi:hypothetical protein
MQTFLPYVDERLVAGVLDDKRLGKQRVEGKQILDLLEGRTLNNWVHHPAVRMWRGYVPQLKRYVNTMIREWINRGKNNNMPLYDIDEEEGDWLPGWFNDARLIYSHRANLVKKFPEHYGPKWPYVDTNTPYWWPVELKTKSQQKMLDEFWGLHRCVVSEIIDNELTIILIEDDRNYGTPSWEFSWESSWEIRTYQ